MGDDAQSIYAFRGADFKTVHEFNKLVEGGTVYRLTENYRSTQEILDVSNWLCASDRCPVVVGNVLVYRDSNHITTKFAEVLAPLIDAAVSPYVEAVRQRTKVS